MCRLSRVKGQQKVRNCCTAPGEPYLKKSKNLSDAEFRAERDPVICNLKVSSGLDILAEHRTLCTTPNITNLLCTTLTVEFIFLTGTTARIFLRCDLS